MKKPNFKCFFNNFSCDKLNTLTMVQEISCHKCNHYDNGVRESKGTPFLGWLVNLFNS